jgi:hypothetical protein
VEAARSFGTSTSTLAMLTWRQVRELWTRVSSPLSSSCLFIIWQGTCFCSKIVTQKYCHHWTFSISWFPPIFQRLPGSWTPSFLKTALLPLLPYFSILTGAKGSNSVSCISGPLLPSGCVLVTIALCEQGTCPWICLFHTHYLMVTCLVACTGGDIARTFKDLLTEQWCCREEVSKREVASTWPLSTELRS